MAGFFLFLFCFRFFFFLKERGAALLSLRICALASIHGMQSSAAAAPRGAISQCHYLNQSNLPLLSNRILLTVAMQFSRPAPQIVQ